MPSYTSGHKGRLSDCGCYARIARHDGDIALMVVLRSALIRARAFRGGRPTNFRTLPPKTALEPLRYARHFPADLNRVSTCEFISRWRWRSPERRIRR
jgi:hypothetical protein